ncbi:hypothetical protein [Desulfobacter sp.]
MKKHHKYTLLGFQALKRATAQAIKEAQTHNYKIPYWKDGKILAETPELNSEQNTELDREN